MPLLHQALVAVRDVAAGGGRVLFVGTKRQAQEPIADAAKRCAQYYVNHRWLGGTLTNWKTISHSIKRLRELDELLDGEGARACTKKELLQLTRERDKLELALGGIKDMGGLPDLMFVIDTNKEAIAIQEARKLSIPVVAILDTNSDPDGITYPIPGNDDAPPRHPALLRPGGRLRCSTASRPRCGVGRRPRRGREPARGGAGAADRGASRARRGGEPAMPATDGRPRPMTRRGRWRHGRRRARRRQAQARRAWPDQPPAAVLRARAARRGT